MKKLNILLFLILLGLLYCLSFLSIQEIFYCDKEKDYCHSTSVNIYNIKTQRDMPAPSKISRIYIQPEKKRNKYTVYSIHLVDYNGVDKQIFIYRFYINKNALRTRNSIEEKLNDNNNFIEYKNIGLTNKVL